jgi:hypothetical protein
VASPIPILADPEKRKIFLDSIRGGNYREVACRAVGITRMSLSRYLSSEDDPDAAQFKADIEAAEALVEHNLVNSVIKMADKGNLQAAQWYLATKFSSRWGNNAKELKEALKLLREIGEQRKSGDSTGQSPQE